MDKLNELAKFLDEQIKIMEDLKIKSKLNSILFDNNIEMIKN